MNEKRIKNIWGLSKERKSRLEKRYNYWNSIFLGFDIAIILFLLDTLILFIKNSFETNLEFWVRIGGALFLVIFVFSSLKKAEDRLSAIALKEENIISLKKARKYLS